MMFFILLFPLLSSFGSSICPKGGVMTMNGDNGLGDNCEFYLDIYRMENLASSPSCYTSLVPPTKSQSLDRRCSGYVDSYFKRGVQSTFQEFKDELERNLKLGGEKTLVTVTDHGAKLPLSGCQIKSKEDIQCVEKKFERESYFSVGSDKIGETDLRQMLTGAREEQKKELCSDSSKDCKLPSLIMNFDHCFSGGMHNAFFDQNGAPLENMCGISAASENEYSYTGENIAKGINELRYGVTGKYKDYYRKYDSDNDGKFSVSEVFDYINKKAKKSVPLKTSDKFLLNYFENNGLSPHQVSCSAGESPAGEITSILGEGSYSADFEKFHKQAGDFLGRKEEISSAKIDELIEAEENALQLMKFDKNQLNFLDEMINQFQEDFSRDVYAEVLSKSQQRDELNNEIWELEEKYCLEDAICKQLLQKDKDLWDAYDKEYDKGTDASRLEELQKVATENYNKLDVKKKELTQTSCSGKCVDLSEKVQRKQQLDIEIQEKKDQIKKDNRNKPYVAAFIEKVEKFVSPYKDKSLDKFVQDQKKIMLSDSFLQRGDIQDFKNDFEKCRDSIFEQTQRIQETSHGKYVRSRKALNQLKMSSALKDMINKQDAEKLKHYEMIKECEKTPLLEYKR